MGIPPRAPRPLLSLLLILPFLGLDSVSAEATDEWFLFNLAAGAGYGDRPDVGYGDRSPGLQITYEILGIGAAIGGAGGFGCGATLFEGRWCDTDEPGDSLVDGEAKRSPSSWFPLYAYFPLFHGDGGPYGYLFAGGSAWGRGFDYAHAGVVVALPVNLTGDTWGGPEHEFFRVKTGVHRAFERTGPNGASIGEEWLFYAALEFGLGGMMFW